MLIVFLKLPASANFLNNVGAAEATLGTVLTFEINNSGKVAGGAAGNIAGEDSIEKSFEDSIEVSIEDSTLALLAGMFLLFSLRELTFAVNA